MATQVKESTGTAVATRDEHDEAQAVGKLPPEIQQAIELRKMQNIVAAKLAGLSWGQNLDHNTRRAIAEYGRRYGIDVTTEMDILGNRPYLNSRYYLRRLAELVEAGLVEYAVPDHIEADPRLAEIAADKNAPAHIRESAIAENYRRAMMRVEFQAPDKAASVVVFRIKLRALTREIVGCKWAGNGTRKNDPVGEASPVESSESRAARRAVRQIASHVPAFARQVEEVEIAAAELEGQIHASIAEVERGRALDPGRRDTRSLVGPMQREYSGEAPDPATLRPLVADVETRDPYADSLFPEDEPEPPFQMD